MHDTIFFYFGVYIYLDIMTQKQDYHKIKLFDPMQQYTDLYNRLFTIQRSMDKIGESLVSFQTDYNANKPLLLSFSYLFHLGVYDFKIDQVIFFPPSWYRIYLTTPESVHYVITTRNDDGFLHFSHEKIDDETAFCRDMMDWLRLAQEGSPARANIEKRIDELKERCL